MLFQIEPERRESPNKNFQFKVGPIRFPAQRTIKLFLNLMALLAGHLYLPYYSYCTAQI